MSSSPMRFDGRVAIVTGAGNGLGRAHALAFAARGAKVVVNDLGGGVRGDDGGGGASQRVADKVVEEIRAAGGEAVANYDSVEHGDRIVKSAVDAFGTVDIVVNNAGILRDVSFKKMSDKDWNLMYAVHLKGAYSVTRAAWPIMRKKKYGRVICTSSAAGLYGNFGQAHYAAVKLALVGFAQTLAKEGARSNILVNTIAPLAGSRMTETIMPPELVAALKPEYVTPLVQFLCHESTKATGGTYEVGAGWVSQIRRERSAGVSFDLSEGAFSPEAARDAMARIRDFGSGATHPTAANDAFAPIMANLESAKSGGKKEKKKQAAGGGNPNVDLDKVLSSQMATVPFSYTERDLVLYALGVGAAADQMDPKELRFVYEGAPDFCALPTFGVVVPSGALAGMFEVPGLKFNPMMLLHGEQFLEVRSAVPTSGTLVSQPKITALWDKGKGALLEMEVVTKDEQTGREIFFNRYKMFIRGLGGFSGDKGPREEPVAVPQRPPDVVHREQTADNQALLYRLSGDMNPLHADPAMAKMGGFDKPILHGLASFGYAARAVLRHFADNDAARFKSIRVRFVSPVFPGETLVTEMWQTAPDKVAFRVRVAERGKYVLNNAEITLHVAGGGGAAAASPAAAPAAAGSFKATAVFAELAKRVSADTVKKVGASYRFDLTDAGGASKSWLVDLKSGAGSVTESGAKADCVIIMKDADFVKLMTGKLDPQQAFMKGQLKLKGNMMLAQKLGALTEQKAAL